VKSATDLNADILKITQKIRAKAPELLKYLDEMPLTIPNEAQPEIDIKILEDFYNSLVNIYQKYEQNQPN
jgi:hypothetical protein